MRTPKPTASGIVVNTDTGPTRVRGVDAAIRVARDHIGQFLAPASHGGVPWGLLVTVAEGVAAYGEWPLSGGRASPSFQQTLLARYPTAVARSRPAVRVGERCGDHPYLQRREDALKARRVDHARSFVVIDPWRSSADISRRGGHRLGVAPE